MMKRSKVTVSLTSSSRCKNVHAIPLARVLMHLPFCSSTFLVALYFFLSNYAKKISNKYFSLYKMINSKFLRLMLLTLNSSGWCYFFPLFFGFYFADKWVLSFCYMRFAVLQQSSYRRKLHNNPSA